MRTQAPAILIILVIACISVFFFRRYQVPPVVDIPTLALTDLRGDQVSLASYRGRPLFISFFATWSGPCMRELPELIEFKAKLADKNLQVVCISDEAIDKLQAIQTRLGDQLLILHAGHSVHDIGIYTYPTNYIYDAHGREVYHRVNPDDWQSAALAADIRKRLDR